MHKQILPAALLLQLVVFGSAASAQESVAKPVSRTAYLLRERYVDARLLVASPASDSVRHTPDRLSGSLPVPQGNAHRTRNMLIGGVIGSALGIGICTGISSLMNDSAKGGFSTCTAKGNIAFAAGGFVAGALVGAAVR